MTDGLEERVDEAVMKVDENWLSMEKKIKRLEATQFGRTSSVVSSEDNPFDITHEIHFLEEFEKDDKLKKDLKGIYSLPPPL